MKNVVWILALLVVVVVSGCVNTTGQVTADTQEIKEMDITAVPEYKTCLSNPKYTPYTCEQLVSADIEKDIFCAENPTEVFIRDVIVQDINNYSKGILSQFKYNCATGGNLTIEECRQWQFKDMFFEYYRKECKTIQIKECLNVSDEFISSLCFSNMASNYKDENLCDYIFTLASRAQSYDVDDIYDNYWECKAEALSDPSYCAYIKDSKQASRCLG